MRREGSWDTSAVTHFISSIQVSVLLVQESADLPVYLRDWRPEEGTRPGASRRRELHPAGLCQSPGGAAKGGA